MRIQSIRSDENCSICLDELKNDAIGHGIACHYHHACLKEWAEKADELRGSHSDVFPCPKCREDLNKSDLLTMKDRCFIELKAIAKDATKVNYGFLAGSVVGIGLRQVKDFNRDSITIAGLVAYIAWVSVFSATVMVASGLLKRHCRRISW